MTAELLRDLDRSTGWTLMVDGAEQSYVDVADPTHLEFEYMQHMALVVDTVLPPPTPLPVLHLGGGACTLPRWIAATRPGSTQVVVEASREILDAVRPLGPILNCHVIHGDAMEQLRAAPDGHEALVVWDLYDGPRVATTTLTLDSIGQMRRVLRPRGCLLLNVSDSVPFDVVRPVLAALRVVFDDVALLAEPSTLRGRRSGNCVLVAATAQLPLPTLQRRAAAAPVRGRLLAGEVLTGFIAEALPPTAERPLPEPDEQLGRGFL